MNSPVVGQGDPQDIGQKAKVKPEEERCHVRQCQGSRSNPDLLDSGDTKSDAEHIDCKIKNLNEDVGATPRPQKAVTPNEQWIGDMFSHEKFESLEDPLSRRNAPGGEQQEKDAAYSNRINLGDLHDREKRV